MRKLTTLLAIAIGLSSAISAQKISGVVKDQQGKGVDKTTVSLLRGKDSSIVKLAVSDNEGRFSFQANAGQYLLSFSHVGFQTIYSEKFEVASSDFGLGDIAMVKAEASLKGVTVTSQKPMVEVRADKTILNVEGTINAVGNDALELLRRAPGIMVDKDDNLTMAGKNGVQVFIDGKPSPLSGADLANYLKSLQAVQIEAIEVITNPSAKYEAAGNAGILNIRLKKNKTFGANGTLNAGYNIGTYAKYNGGGSLNYRNAKFNLFGNYNYNQSKNINHLNLYRVQGDSTFDQPDNQITSYNKGHNFKGGLDYFINKNSTIGAMVNGNISKNDIYTRGPMYIYHTSSGVLDRVLDAGSDNQMNRSNVNFNANYRYAKPGGSELNVDVDYGFFNLRNDQFQFNNYYDASQSNKLHSTNYRMISPTDIDIYSVKVDYEQNFAKGRLGYGGKIGFVNTDNNFNRYDVIAGQEYYDKDRSNRFEYKENVNAGYINYNKAFKGFMLQLGVRVENTHSEGLSTGLKKDQYGNYNDYDSTIDRNYTDVFPSAAITFNKNPMSQFAISFSRRIDRPAYQDLNPFEFKLNDYTFMKGNTQLRPQYTNSIGITHTYKYKLNTTLNYSHVKDIFTQVPDTIDGSKGFMMKKNLATQDVISLNISYPFQYKWYGFFVNLNSYYSKYKADFGGGDRNVDQDIFAVSFYMQNTFKLAKGFLGEVSGFYNSPTLWQGMFKSNALYSVDAGLQKPVMKGKLNIKASVSDVFKTLKWKADTDFTGVYMRASGYWESRQFKINLTYRFGNTQVKATRQRKTGSEDENKRVSDGSGTSPVGQ